MKRRGDVRPYRPIHESRELSEAYARVCEAVGIDRSSGNKSLDGVSWEGRAANLGAEEFAKTLDLCRWTPEGKMSFRGDVSFRDLGRRCVLTPEGEYDPRHEFGAEGRNDVALTWRLHGLPSRKDVDGFVGAVLDDGMEWRLPDPDNLEVEGHEERVRAPSPLRKEFYAALSDALKNNVAVGGGDFRDMKLRPGKYGFGAGGVWAELETRQPMLIGHDGYDAHVGDRLRRLRLYNRNARYAKPNLPESAVRRGRGRGTVNEAIGYSGGVHDASLEESLCREVADTLLRLFVLRMGHAGARTGRWNTVRLMPAMPDGEGGWVTPVVTCTVTDADGEPDDRSMTELLELGAEEAGDGCCIYPSFDRTFVDSCAKALRGRVGATDGRGLDSATVKKDTRAVFSFSVDDPNVDPVVRDALFSFEIDFVEDASRKDGVIGLWPEDAMGKRERRHRARAFAASEPPNLPESVAHAGRPWKRVCEALGEGKGATDAIRCGDTEVCPFCGHDGDVRVEHPYIGRFYDGEEFLSDCLCPECGRAWRVTWTCNFRSVHPMRGTSAGRP